MKKPKAIILCGDGINCEDETAYALSITGFAPELLHITDLLNNNKILDTGELFVIPGGFSFADQIRSGKVLAIKMKNKILTQLDQFIEQGKLVIGICNGFQVLTTLGLLPDSRIYGPHSGALLRNKTGKFSNHWVNLIVNENTKSPFLSGLKKLYLPTRHGEGQLLLDDKVISSLDPLVCLRYENNFNGSYDSIAAMTNKTGNVFGIMPHPEAYIRWSQHPAWTSMPSDREPDGLVFFKNVFNALN